MMMVLVILVDFTTPERIRPRIETSPVKGHFLSERTKHQMNTQGQLNRIPSTCGARICRLTDVGSVDGLGRGLEAKTDILVPTLGPGVDLLSAYAQPSRAIPYASADNPSRS
jgi:hypothetical protein